MIPRRRLPLEAADLADWLRAPFRRAEAVAADVAAFERAFADLLGVPCARAVASGRDALGLILDGLGLQAGDELIIPAYTLGELLPLLQSRGLRLVPADIDPATYNLTPESVRARIGPATRALLVVHLLGAPCDLPALAALADEAGIALIEDCAHAAGATVDGRPVGSVGIAALFSLEANKALCAFGGGVLATRDAGLLERIAPRLAHRPRREWPAMKKAMIKWCEELLVRSPAYGPLARLLFSDRAAQDFERFYRGAHGRVRPAACAFSGFQARLALRRLRRLAQHNARNNAAWRDTAARLPAALTPQRRDAVGEPAFYNLVACYDGDLRRLRAAALARGIDLGIHGEVMDDTAAMLGDTGCPQAAAVHRQAVLLPLYPGLGERRRAQLLERLARAVEDAA
ncbi:MAG: DegT/DnrJ/EryC1/StrS family aminotransferase [Rhodocyclaceae bacterium]|nr:DegT/DnrJ/EryC1/StrS family aminotransferase [Rhodocyclaceae bacterium]